MSRRYLILILVVGCIFIGGMTLLVIKSDFAPSAAGVTTKKTGLAALFPFLSPGSATPAPSGNSTSGGSSSNVTPTSTASGPVYFKQISSQVLAGLTALPFDPTAASTTHSAIGNDDSVPVPMVRYTERGTGYIYDIRADGGSQKKVSDTIVSHAAIAQFGTNGTTVVMRFIKADNATVGTFLGTVTPPNDPNAGIAGTLVGSFLPDNIIDIAISPDGNILAYEAPTSGGSVGMSEKMDGTGKKQIFENAFSEWLLDWKGAGVTLTTKAASDLPGYSYVVNSSQNLEKVLGPASGLTTLTSPDGKEILYGTGANGSMQLHLMTIKTGADISTGLQTLPEKCTWSSDSTAVYCGVPQYVPAGSYPDTWYQGSVHFDDAIWKIDPSNGNTTKITTGSEGLIDATYLTLSPDDSYLFLINKTDGSLWSLNLAKALGN